MLERQVKEGARRHGDKKIKPPRNGPLRHGAGERVSRIGTRAATKHIARELIEHDHERQCALAPRLPSVQPAGRAIVVCGLEPFADFRVERLVRLVPPVLTGGEPERHNVLRGLLRWRARFVHVRIRSVAPALEAMLWRPEQSGHDDPNASYTASRPNRRRRRARRAGPALPGRSPPRPRSP